MRLWSLHPCYLDRQGLLAVWREGLLAQKVLQNRTKGYKNHPQLMRFRTSENPLGAIGYYLREIVQEAKNRGYVFDSSKIGTIDEVTKIPVTRGQIRYEQDHLARKLLIRDSCRVPFLKQEPYLLHPLFFEVEGDIEEWELIK
ncbi:MAG: pyrimidine dimer DNA glycosylase/endonuclease V [Candidatus Gracilibacteria bacterium]|nr:pyrimidine dimer DNA glycosylase/endonuclease V [Candidatus Gracilibacteria bacterium]